MSTHTPGPWTAILDRDRDDEDTWYVLTEKEAAIAVGLYGPDARLIAAAPELLAACKALVEAGGNSTSLKLGSEQLQRFVSAWGDMRAAIAKAEGVS